MKIAPEILAVLDRAEIEGRAVTLPERLDRKTYLACNEVLEAAGGAWNRKAKAHLFPEPAADALDAILLAGEVTTQRDFGFFPTPQHVAREMARRADICPGMIALEPSAGIGSLAFAMADAGAIVRAIELQEAHANFLRQGGCFDRVECADFLTIEPAPIYDRVLMNPPFGKRADLEHVTHALRFLEPDGMLLAIMAAGVAFREDRKSKAFRSLISQRGGEIEFLPEGTFAESGTGVNTVLVTIPAEA